MDPKKVPLSPYQKGIELLVHAIIIITVLGIFLKILVF